MPRPRKPWWRKSRGHWTVTIDGRQYNLGPDREEAFQRYHELMANPEMRSGVDCEGLPALIDAFLDWTHKHRAKRTYEFYQERLQEFLDHAPRLTVAQLKPFHVQRWVDAKDCSNGHKRGCIKTVQRALNWAVKMGYVDNSPIAHMEKPPGGKREDVLTEEEFHAVLSHVTDDVFGDLLWTMWETGCRPQEALNVEARHVELERARWVFPRQEAKNKTRPRIVYLSDRALEITKKNVLKHPQGKLFRNRNGRPWTRYAVNCRFKRLKQLTGKRVCLYVFRHSFATRMLKSGVDALTVALLLGHSDVSMLGRVYQHLSQSPEYLAEQLRKAAG